MLVKIIAAALDGDGDRCLFIESTETGCRIVDGDEMADHILRSANGKWHLAASIESDLSLISSLDRLDADVQFSQTAVGDRWLSHALKSSDCNILGVEDSGHLVMASPHPQGGRCLVGDGVASMLAVLCAMACENRAPAFAKGFKRRVSISPSNRSRWTGDNDLANTVEFIANKKLGEMERSGLVGEANLMLLESRWRIFRNSKLWYSSENKCLASSRFWKGLFQCIGSNGTNYPNTARTIVRLGIG